MKASSQLPNDKLQLYQNIMSQANGKGHKGAGPVDKFTQRKVKISS